MSLEHSAQHNPVGTTKKPQGFILSGSSSVNNWCYNLPLPAHRCQQVLNLNITVLRSPGSHTLTAKTYSSSTPNPSLRNRWGHCWCGSHNETQWTRKTLTQCQQKYERGRSGHVYTEQLPVRRRMHPPEVKRGARKNSP